MTLKVESEDLDGSISVDRTAWYNTSRGFIGIRFGELQAESTAMIINYMKRFQRTTPETEDPPVDSDKKAS